MTKLLVWNVRGFNRPLKQHEVRKMIVAYGLNIICLLETRVQKENSSAILSRMLSGWRWFSNYSSHRLGRIWILYDHSITLLETLVTD